MSIQSKQAALVCTLFGGSSILAGGWSANKLIRQYVDAWGRFREVSFLSENRIVIVVAVITLAAGVIALILGGVLHGLPREARRMTLCRNTALLKVLVIPIAIVFPAMLYPGYGWWEAPKMAFQHPEEGLLVYQGPLRGVYVAGASHAYIVHAEFLMFVPKEVLVRRVALHPVPPFLLYVIGFAVAMAATWVWSIPRDLLAAYRSFRAPMRPLLDTLSSIGEREVSIPGLFRFAFSLRPTRLQEKVLQRIEKEVERAKRIRGEVAVSARAQDVEKKRAQYDAMLHELAGKFARRSKEFRQASAALAPETSFAKKREAITALTQALHDREKPKVVRKRTPPPPKPPEPTPPLRLVPSPSPIPRQLPGSCSVTTEVIEKGYQGERFLPEGVNRAMGRAIMLELIDCASGKKRVDNSHHDDVPLRRKVKARYDTRGQVFEPREYRKTLRWLVYQKVLLLDGWRLYDEEAVFSLCVHVTYGKSVEAQAVIGENIRFLQFVKTSHVSNLVERRAR